MGTLPHWEEALFGSPESPKANTEHRALPNPHARDV